MNIVGIIIFLGISFLILTLFSFSNPLTSIAIISLLFFIVMPITKSKNNNQNNKFNQKNIILGIIYFIIFFIAYYFIVAWVGGLLVYLFAFITGNFGDGSDNGLYAYALILGFTLAPILSIVTTKKYLIKIKKKR